MSETPFKIAIPDDRLALLQKKLELTIFPDELEDAGRDYGSPLADIKRLAAHWRSGFDWRKQEAALNADLPQFTRDIAVDGHGTLNVHYVHVRSAKAGAIPLLFVHGWPGSFIEARKIAPLLAEGAEGQPSFHVVALSLPGFGFSEQPHKRGFAIPQYGEVAHKLMLALGYETYVTQGGDWGAGITRYMSLAYGVKHVKAWHTNMPTSFGPDPPNVQLTPEEQEQAKLGVQWREKEGAYLRLQSTKPQTLGYGMTDSPVGLLAWIYEKLVSWTHNYPWTDDEVLTWISIYWFSRAGPTASFRIYYESFSAIAKAAAAGQALPPPSSIPLGFTILPGEIVISPKPIRDLLGNVVFEEKHDKGGHFAAYEVPEILVGDLRKMYAKGGPAYGVVEGKDGY
ncbi:alpha/beta-hydrolase [Schizophyllum commune H4-8]|uniref:Epoxide hydrolase N-terminal domain-containing protein n=1 Tax=Schizophyllum commune (strain H4-8 / FGSC 9210) TaxID=578458 RepID=D8Q0L2_SCHCM|nr:alpha/beta-hydrolase [Schizophyllum commune H4-8]KAI5895058.1 alpha/beta-hydrolase [Schizophyllum commune H4-8]